MNRRAFSLLEVMVSLAILVVSLAILVETMGSAIVATREAEHIVTATQLAQEKLSEVLILVEKEGVTERERTESGDFTRYDDAQIDLEFGAALEDYKYEWWISQIEVGLVGDLADLAQTFGGDTTDVGGQEMENQAPSLASLGVSNDMIGEMLGRYIREVRVRVWWGEDSDRAEELGDEVILTQHITDPTGGFVNLGGGAAAGGAAP